MDKSIKLSIIDLILIPYSFLKKNTKGLLNLTYLNIVFYLIFFLCTFAITLIFKDYFYYQNINSKTFILFYLLMFLLNISMSFLQLIPLSMAKYISGLWFVKNEKISIKEAFNYIRPKLISLFGSQILIILLICLLVFLSLIPMGINLGLLHMQYQYNTFYYITPKTLLRPWVIISQMLLIIPIIYFSLRLSFNFDSIIFNNKSATKSITHSLKVTKKSVFQTLLYYLVSNIFNSIIMFVMIFVMEIVAVITIVPFSMNDNLFLVVILLGILWFVAFLIILTFFTFGMYSGQTLKYLDLCNQKGIKTILHDEIDIEKEKLLN